MFSKMGFKLKFTLVVLLFVFSGITLSVTTSYLKSKASLIDMADQQLLSLRINGARTVSDFFQQTVDYTVILGKDRLMEGLMLAYESAFFATGLPIGKDHQLTGNKSFTSLDAKYGEKVNLILKSFSLGNILLTNISGQVVFSAIQDKGWFLGRNMTGGELKGSGMEKCYSDAMKSNGEKPFFADYAYYPQFKKTMSFFCIKFFAEFDHLSEGIKKGDQMGVVIVQVSTDKINEFLGRREGLGQTGQLYVVGPDHLLRSNFYLEKEKFNIDTVHNEKREIHSDAIDAALTKSLDGVMNNIGPLGREVESAYTPIEVFGNKWAVVADMRIEEVVAPATNLLIFVLSASLGLFVIIGFLVVTFVARSMRPIQEVSDTLKNVSITLTSEADTMSKSSQDLNSAATQQKSYLLSTISAVNEISVTIAGNSKNAENSLDVSGKSLRVANEGKVVIDEMIESMGEIDKSNEDLIHQVEQSNAKLQEIVQMISNIGEKTKVINDIVFQTKLLSFNASVEAARAGEQGKGFAVVADEVSNLAALSGRSAGEITALLTESTERVNDIVTETKHAVEKIALVGKSKVEGGMKTAIRCREVFDQILENVETVNKMIEEIARASKEQSRGMDEIDRAMPMLNSNADNASIIAKESADSGVRLNTEAVTLSRVVETLAETLNGRKDAA